MKESKKEFGVLAATCFFCYILTLVLFITGYLNRNLLIEQFMQVILAGTAISVFIMLITRKLTTSRLTAIILGVGYFLRIGLAMYKPTYKYWHDMGEISLDNYSHAGYILKIYTTHRLPQVNYGQCYHPPFSHILCAVSMEITRIFTNITDMTALFEMCIVVSLSASCITLYLSILIARELGLSKTGQLVTLAIHAFLPVFTLSAGWVNNDALVNMFIYIIILYTFRWWKNQSYGNTIILALCFGFGMMTKNSCSIYAFFTGSVMLFKWIEKIRKKQGRQLIGKFISFGMIAFPLGMWYPVRNWLRFGQPFNYVLDITNADGSNRNIESFFQRFIKLDVTKILNPLFCDPYEDYNAPMYVLKTASYGEFSYHHTDALGITSMKIIVLVNLLLIILAIGSFIYVVIVKRKYIDWRFKIALPSLWIFLLLFYIWFNYKLPFPCSMDARYLLPTILTGSLFLGQMTQLSLAEQSLYKKVPGYLTIAAIIVLAASSGCFLTRMLL